MEGAAEEAGFDQAECERLLSRVASTEEPAWRALAALLWPALLRFARETRGMASLRRSEDHVRNVAVLVLDKLGRDGCRAARLHDAWREAHPDKRLGDWLRIVVANVARDYARERRGRAAGDDRPDKRLLHSLATLLPEDEGLPAAALISATSLHAARELLAWAEARLPADQAAALAAWLRGTSFEEIAAALGAPDGAAAKRRVRAALATLRRHAAMSAA